ncbi:hypothetical protein [Mangrovimonas sp. TPBH4]|uniref:hypothetical protein n=1 Tax=Mangrovimonas sp. TPBH4 TaxID=1645914 RepID=UPI0006B508E4|nr:hypothetical protein [Mangrovimonas sp. TPBH4]
MGANVSNAAHGAGYSTGEKFIELHRRIILNDEAYSKAVSLLNENKYDEAKEFLLKVSPQNASDAINVFLNDLKEIRKS